MRDVASRARKVANNSSESATIPTPVDKLQQSSSNHVSMSSSIDGRRNKRQSSGREQLCQTTYQYITPQAALNSQGITKLNTKENLKFEFNTTRIACILFELSSNPQPIIWEIICIYTIK